MSPRKIAAATLLSAGLLMAGNAAAEVSGSVTVVSDYLFRGITQTNEEPALQAGLTWEHESGFYAGAWGSSISWLSDADPEISSQVELDGFIGYAGSFGESDFGYDVGANYYWYPGDYPAGFTDADTLELYLGVSYKFLSAKYWYAVTDLFGIPDSDGSTNLDLSASFEFEDGWSTTAAVGKQWVKGVGGTGTYAFWKVGVDKAFDSGFGIGLSYNDNDLIGPDETFVLSLSKSF
ncbi:TorF family putative porin [Luteimonas saliphila]|uniref:TorF family putative porin n=1 Tax=Luteimonas saliphila TaxID=2804919 RepID=UPI00192D2DF3|nr:TorF family putative porin [Luteimonas saliphila]